MRRVPVPVWLPVVVLLAVALVLHAPPARAASSQTVAATSVGVQETPPDGAAPDAPTTVAGDEAGIGGLEPASNAPSPRGEPAPPRTQRIADTMIFVGLLVVFVGGVAVALRSATRSREP